MTTVPPPGPTPPPELDSLIQAARGLEGPSPEVAARLFERLDASTGGLAPPSSPGATGLAVPKLVVLLAGATLVVGGALVGNAWLSPRQAPVQALVPVEPPREAPPAAPVEPQQPSAEPPAHEEERKPVARPANRVPQQALAPASTLEEERKLLDEARTALVAQNWAEALEALTRHEARFASGVLSEEREALAIQALYAQDPATAARRAKAFRKRWPSSFFEPVIEKVAPRDGSSASSQ